MITLSEAYRRLDKKNIRARRRINEAVERDIPAQFRKYFKISDYEPSGDEYQLGDRVDDYQIAAYLEPKDQYEDTIEMCPFLLKGKEGFIVADISQDRVYPTDIEEVTSYLDESAHRSARRRVNENRELDYPLQYVRSHTLSELVGRGFARYFQFCDKPINSEYDIGDALRSAKYFEGYLVGFVEPKPAYKDKLKPFYYLRGQGSFIDIVDIVDGLVEYLNLSEIKSYLGESKKMPSTVRSRRRVTENFKRNSRR